MSISEHQKFTMRSVWRSSIKEHPKNPRTITENAKKKLKGKMQEVGLLQPLIVNERTGYLLGGHQRLSVLDGLEKYKNGSNDYEIEVAVVDLNEKQELEILVFLNNPGAQGGWELEMLAEINLDAGIGFGDMGFDKMDIDLMFDGDARFNEIFPDPIEVKETKNTLEEIRSARHEGMQRMEDRQGAQFYCVVVCRDEQEKKDLLKKMNVADYETYVSSETVFAALK
jgi:hypothetical protein